MAAVGQKVQNVMKKVFTVFVLLALSVAVYAQKDVTKFLGIPVDGSKTEMIQELKAKGFTYDKALDRLYGTFNGYDVNVYIVTNNDKVYRIMVCDKYSQDAGDIKIRFNTLCRQFLDNKKYVSLSENDIEIPESENIAYEMTVNNKRYEACFFQLPEDTTAIMKKAREVVLSYKKERLANPSEELEKDMMKTIYSYVLDQYMNKTVWFMIGGEYGQYSIYMFYDNKYNQANGEDL